MAQARRWPAALAGELLAVAVPFGADGYLRRVGDALTRWAVETEAAFDGHQRSRAATLRRIRRLRPPPGSEPVHARVLALADRPAGEDLADASERAAATYAEVAAVRHELAAGRAFERHRRYASALDELLSERLRAADEALARADAAAASARRGLERARPPDRATAAHAELVDAFVGAAVADRALRAAWRHGDPAAARAAAERVTAAYAALERAWDAVVGALHDHTIANDASG
jgi:hypothetical protein